MSSDPKSRPEESASSSSQDFPESGDGSNQRTRAFGERRLASLQQIVAACEASGDKSVQETCEVAIDILSSNESDLPFVALYLLESDARSARLAAQAGLSAEQGWSPAEIDLEDPQAPWPLKEVLAENKMLELSSQSLGLPKAERAPWPKDCELAVLSPLAKRGKPRALGFLVAGVSSKLPFDHCYRAYFELVAQHVANAIANAQNREDVRKRSATDAKARASVTALRRDIGSALSGATPFEACCDALTDHVGAKSSRIWTVDTNSKLTLQCSSGCDSCCDTEDRNLSKTETDRLLAIHEAKLSQPDSEPSESPTILPLVVERSLVGLLEIETPEPLDQIVTDGLLLLADQIALHIQNKKANDTLLESELRYRLVGQAANDAIWDWNLLTNQVVWNDGVRTFFGYSKAQIDPDASWWVQNIHAEDREKIVHDIHAAIDSGKSQWRDEYRFRRADGTYAQVIDRGQIVRDDSGRPTRMVGSMLDLTERLKAERRIQEQETQYRSIFESTNDAILVFDYSGTLREVNPAGCRMHGYTYDEFIGMHGTQFVHPDDHPKFGDFVESVSAGKDFYVNGVHVRKDGSFLSIQVVGTSFIYAGQPALLAVVRNVTEERKALEALQQSEENFRVLAENIPQLVWMANPDGHIFWYNSRWYDYTGTSPQDMEGWGWQSVHDPKVLPSVLTSWRESIATGQPFDMVFPLKGADGTFRPFLTRIIPHRTAEGVIKYWFGTNTDITEQRKNQEKLRKLAAELSEANRRKTEFLATLGHELRNPLAPIRTGLEILKVAQDPEDREETRAIMERQALQMVRLIDDLLDVSRITQGKLKLQTRVVRLQEIVKSATEASQPLIQESGHTLEVQLPSSDIQLEADPNRLAQVFSNLLNNAAKYTPEGGSISLKATVEDDRVAIAVKDNGIGIAKELQSGIFEMFNQIDRPLERGYKGLGIGLTLVKRLVEMHNGSIEVSSEGLNQGSLFTVRLPCGEARPQTQAPTLPSGREKRDSNARVLVVDDNKAAADMLSLVVGRFGNEVRTAYDGQEGIQIAETFLPHLILMDLGMPLMNGYEAARHIRQQSWGKDMALVALTGWGQEEDRVRTQEAGFDHHLVKPAEPDTIRSLINSLELD